VGTGGEKRYPLGNGFGGGGALGTSSKHIRKRKKYPCRLLSLHQPTKEEKMRRALMVVTVKNESVLTFLIHF